MNGNTKHYIKTYGGWLFLGCCVLIYIGLMVFDTNLGIQVLKKFGAILWEILPVMIIVVLFVFFFNLFLDPKKISKFFGKKSGAKGWTLAILGGILSSGPGYMWYPMLEDMRKRGMRPSLAVAFLYNRGVQIPLLPMMLFYFGFWFTIFMTIYMTIFSVINGFAVEKLIALKKPKKIFSRKN
ncbi:permease [Patescibacteria group bacterium]|nr:permease [Patescibacteria group bacterium]MBU1673629.1 permease [Patescibacteria group bacterium]MBU1963883.1 permease [Patescibacteria group bacterium]